MGVLNDEHGAGPDPIDVATQARGDWEDTHADEIPFEGMAAWQSDIERAEWLASQGLF